METGPHLKLKKTEILTAGDKQTAGGLVAMGNQMKLLDEVQKNDNDNFIDVDKDDVNYEEATALAT